MIPAFLFAALIPQVPLTAKHLPLDPDRITTLQCKVGWLTEIDFPKNRTIQSFRVGEEGFWEVTKANNVLFIRPMDVPQIGGGKKTNISVSLDTGSYTLAVEEISKVQGATPDLKVIADLSNEETNAPAQLVRIELLDAAKAENAALKQQLDTKSKQQTPSIEDAVQREINAWRADYELFDKKGKPEFAPLLAHDDVSTFVFLENVQEIPTVMAFRDGKPDKVQVLYQAGKYTMPYVKEGIIIVGKSQVKFRGREK